MLGFRRGGITQAMKAFVVLNPVAGHSDVQAVREGLNRHLAAAGIAYRVYETTGQERLPEIVRSAIDEGFDTVVAAGGDGTISGVIDGLVHTGLLLGILPVGTVNTLARELDIPLDLESALSLLVGEHATIRMDVGQVEGHCIALNASVGVSTSTMQATGQQEKRRFGPLAYLVPGLKALFGAQPHDFEIEVDGCSRHWRASEVVVANGGTVGDPVLRWGPDIRVDDGQLDLCVVRARSLLDYLLIAWNLLWGTQRRDRRLRCQRVRHSVSIQGRETMPVQVDGEIVGETPIRVEVLPHAVHVIIPEPGKY